MSDTSPSKYTGANGSAWKVLDVNDTTGQGNDGRYTKGQNVTYQLAGGQTGTVFIPATVTTADMASAIINADANRRTSILGLSQGM
jgi:hypothetical protein